MSTRDFMISDIHGHRITSQLKADGWEIFLLAPVAESTAEYKLVAECGSLAPVAESTAEYKLVAECGSLGSAISLAKELNSGKTVEDLIKERTAAEEATKAAAVAAAESVEAASEIPTVPVSESTSEPTAIAVTSPLENVPVPPVPAEPSPVATPEPAPIEVTAPTVEAGIAEAVATIAEEVADQNFGDGVDGESTEK